MKKYIDADKLKEKLDSFISMNETYTDYNCGYDDCLTAVQDTLADIPTADVVAVVRCEDCKHFQFSDESSGMYGECSQAHIRLVKPDGFCSYGKRKDEE